MAIDYNPFDWMDSARHGGLSGLSGHPIVRRTNDWMSGYVVS